MTREATNKILEMMDEGLFDKDQLVRDLLSFMSEDDVRDFADASGIEWEEPEEDSEDDEEED